MCAALYTTLPTVNVSTPRPPRELRAAAARIAPRRAAAATLTLAADQSVRIVTPEGRTLLDIGWSAGGPVLKLADNDVNLRLGGKLSIDAEQIDLTARAGEMRLLAQDDVIVRGEKVRLN